MCSESLREMNNAHYWFVLSWNTEKIMHFVFKSDSIYNIDIFSQIHYLILQSFRLFIISKNLLRVKMQIATIIVSYQRDFQYTRGTTQFIIRDAISIQLTFCCHKKNIHEYNYNIYEYINYIQISAVIRSLYTDQFAEHAYLSYFPLIIKLFTI